MNELTLLSQARCFDGQVACYSHLSRVNQCTMTFAVYLPPQAAHNDQLPVLYWLSGLTCNEQNFITKSGAQRYAAEHGMILVAPDTSPRGEQVPDDPDGAWDFGLGAGFYVNATQAPWSKHYQMYDYISKELPALIEQYFPVDPNKKSLSGHSMGGHGALTIALKNPNDYRSVSAFAPIVAPSQVPWGHKALSLYLGDDRQDWLAYDSCYLIAHPPEPKVRSKMQPQAKPIPILISQGEDDNFLAQQLKPELLEQAAASVDHPISINRHPGYDHSYYFIASFIEQHIVFHANHLQ